jgi:hypothetical protein
MSAKSVWEKVAAEISGSQFSVDGAACANKWKSLKHTYTKISDKNSETGQNQIIPWPFYTEMESAMCGLMGKLSTVNESESKKSSLKISLVNVKTPETYKTRCRICLKTTSSNISFKQSLSERHATTFNDVFSEMTGYTVVYTQNYYPTSICCECKSKLQCFHEFLTTCKRTEKILLAVYTCKTAEEANNVITSAENKEHPSSFTVPISINDKDEDLLKTETENGGKKF